MSHQRPHREPGDLEVGIGGVFGPHEEAHAAPLPEPPRWLTSWEAHRPKWLMELVAEALGSFIFCWGGMGAAAAMLVGETAKMPILGGVLNVALCYAIAIIIAVTITGPTSGAHLNPCFTIAFAVFKGFPWRKVPTYIIAQCVGSFLGSMACLAQYRTPLHAIAVEMIAAGKQAEIFSSAGPAGAVANFLPPGANIGLAFFNEFMTTVILAMVVFSCVDPTNVFVSPTSAAFLIGIIYFVAIAAYSPQVIYVNSARDLMSRAAAAVWWGRGAFPATETCMGLFVNILGTLVGASLQIFFLSDTIRPHTPAHAAAHHAAHVEKEAHLARQLTQLSTGQRPRGLSIGRIISGSDTKNEAPNYVETAEKARV